MTQPTVAPMPDDGSRAGAGDRWSASALDVAPLEARPSPDELAAFHRDLGDGRYGTASRERHAASRGAGRVVLAMIGGLLGLIFGGVTVAAFVRGDSDEGVIGLVATAAVVLVGVGCGWLVGRAERRHWVHVWRLVRFAAANGLAVEPAAPVRGLPGSIFTTTSRASLSERVSWSVAGRAAEVAVYERSGGGSEASTFTARYLAVEVGDAPRMTFVGRARGPARPAMLAGPQATVGTGGRHRGTVTSPPGGADAAATFMTPGLVELLTDPHHPCHAETIGGWFFVYYPVRPRFDAARWRHAFALAETVVRGDRRRRT